VLQRAGITCNHVNGTWTGISLERYRKLISLISEDQRRLRMPGSGSMNNDPCAGYSLPLLLRLLWEISESKDCLMDYFEGVEQGRASVGDSGVITADKFVELRIQGSAMRKSWVDSSFTDHEISSEHVHSAGMEFLKYLRMDNIELNAVDTEKFGACFELVCASLAKDRSFKPAVRLGRYSLDDGPVKPDCVEVVVREVVEGLIFGESGLYAS
jgi:hypothetical protein